MLKDLRASDFNRVLGSWEIFTLAFGAMIGWGWVVLTGEWILQAGVLGALIAFAIGGIVVAFVGLTYSELTAAMPKVGGEHVFSFRGIGINASFVCTWFIILGYVSVCGFEAVALPVVLENLLQIPTGDTLWSIGTNPVYTNWVLIGVGGSVLIGFINYIGIKSAAFVQGIFTLLILIVGLMLILGSQVSGGIVSGEEIWDTKKLAFGLMPVLVMTPFMFVGFDVIPQAAEEINLPYKKIGKTLILSVLIAVFWYTAIIYSTGITLSLGEIKGSSLAPADAMGKIYGGSWAKNLLTIAGLAGILTSWNSFFIGATRAIFAMGQSGMLPGIFGKLNPTFKSPSAAIIFVTLTSVLATLFGKEALTLLVNAGGLGIVVSWMLVSLSFFLLRKKEPNMDRPFKVKSGKLVGCIAILLSLALIYLYFPGNSSALNSNEWGIIGIWTLMGVCFYGWSIKTHSKKVLVQKMNDHVF